MAASQLAARAFASLPDLIAEHAARHPDKRAIVQDGVAVTYGELHALTGRIAASLQHMGVAPRSAVAIVSASTIQSALAFLGALRAGCVAAPLPPSASPQQIASMIADSGAPVVFVDAEAEAVLAPAAATAVQLENLNDWMVSSEVELPATEIAPTDAFNIIYSSGTTGTPKGIVHTHAMRWTQIAGFSTAGLGGAVMMVATPLYSNGTLISFLPTLAFGGTVVLMSKFDACQFLQIAERERATHVMLVPVQIQRIMALPDFDSFDLSSFQFKACGSAPFSAALKADVLRRWPGALMEMYGLTEGGGTCLLMAHEFPNKLHTVGRPAPGHDIRLIDEMGREVAQGGIGEVVGNSGAMMSGYHGRAEATSAAVWTDAQGKRFIRHGDLGRFDEDGFLTLLGRTKDMIISGGFNVYPPDIEAVLLQHPAVAECAVIGVPSEAWGETPYAYYVPRGPGVAASDILEWVNARVGKTQRLSGAEPIAELPHSAIGKVLKRELRDRFLAA